MIFLRSLKCSKATVELTFTTLKSNTCSPWNVCSVFDCKCPFLVNLVETENYQFKLKFGKCTSLNIRNSMVMFTFSIFVWKYPFWANLVQKIKTEICYQH